MRGLVITGPPKRRVHCRQATREDQASDVVGANSWKCRQFLTHGGVSHTRFGIPRTHHDDSFLDDSRVALVPVANHRFDAAAGHIKGVQVFPRGIPATPDGLRVEMTLHR